MDEILYFLLFKYIKIMINLLKFDIFLFSRLTCKLDHNLIICKSNTLKGELTVNS